MKKNFFVMFLLVGATLSAQTNFWENPRIVDEGKESPRAAFIPYATAAQADMDDKFSSPRVKSLNGVWKFSFAEKAADRLTDFYSLDTKDAAWKEIRVPGSWETQGFGVPVYTNIKYIFPPNPPHVDNDDLPIGTYRLWFEVPAEFGGKEIFLNFGSISGAATVCVNGQKVGYSKAAKTPAEFNITPYLQTGKNLLALQIFKWSDASYLEDQDFWRLGGIERDVLLIARPKVSIEDFFIVGDLDKAYNNGLFQADVTLRNFNPVKSGSHKVRLSLSDEAGKKIAAKEWTVAGIPANGNKRVSFAATVPHPEKWSAEHPALYSVVIELLDADGQPAETAGCKTGFKKVEIKNNQLLFNGQPVVIRGVNLHEHHEAFGHYVDPATRLKDLELMKRHNINAIRTSHYPQAPEFYQLCSKYGFYVVDEANIEAHGLDGFDRSRHPSFSDDWRAQHLDRTIRMFERDKNFPCVINWSLGNESDFGPAYEATYRWLKEHDKAKRPVQCNRAEENPFTDIVCPMYDKIHHMLAYADKPGIYRPYIQCEYAHSMGNSTGDFQDYWDAFMSRPALQGGFIWDWVDQGLTAADGLGRKYWAYGGDLGGYRWTHDENFCANGLINADRTPHPALQEVKKVYQSIRITEDFATAKGLVDLRNDFLFTDLNTCDYVWELYADGEAAGSGRWKAEGKPQTSLKATVPYDRSLVKGDKEYFLIVKALTRQATDLVPAGYPIAEEQFLLQAAAKKAAVASDQPTGGLTVRQTDEAVSFATGEIQGKISKRNGRLTEYVYKGKPLITQSPVPNFWRAPTDNDFGRNIQYSSNVWRNAADAMTVVSLTVETLSDETAIVRVEQKINYIDIPCVTQYHLLRDGSVAVTASMNMSGRSHPELVRFGMKMQLPAAFDQVVYYGRGPWENYTDRNTSAFVKKYACRVNELNYDYIRPQENGYRTDVRYVTFTDPTGVGIRFEGMDNRICFNARYNADEDLDPGFGKKQMHPIDVYPRNHLFVNIDLKQMGVGGDDSWGAKPLDKYRLQDGEYSYSYLIKPVDKGQ
jgi:beta-galactosidase